MENYPSIIPVTPSYNLENCLNCHVNIAIESIQFIGNKETFINGR